jgi:antitoxin CptB
LAPRRIPAAAGGDSENGLMDEGIDIRRKRLLYRSAHRGTKESDLLLGAFAAAHLASFTPAQLDRYEALLGENDGELFDWIVGRIAPPPEKQSDVLRLLLSFRYAGAG